MSNTSVILGICKGKRMSVEDENDPRVSKVGGRPSFFVPASRCAFNQRLVCHICGKCEPECLTY